MRVDERVVLRQVTEHDAEELSTLIDRNRCYLREWLPWLDNSNGIHDTSRFIVRSLDQAADENGFTFVIVCDGLLAGVIGQHYLDSLNRRTELGYWLDAAHQGRGIVTRSTARLTDYAFAEQTCNRVIRDALYSAAMRSQVISRYSSPASPWRGGGRRIMRSPSKLTSRTWSLPMRAGSDEASTRVISRDPSNV